MTVTHAPHPSTSARFSRLAPRWALASIVVAAVFVGGRAMTGPPSTSATSDERPGPKAGWTIPNDSTGAAQPDPGSEGESEPDSSPGADVFDDTTNFKGRGADGGTWSLTYPSDWVVHEGPGLTTFDTPDRENVAMVAMRPYVGPLDEEAQRDLGVLMEGLQDAVVDVFDMTTVDGRPAVQAHLDYTTPLGEPASVSVTWIQDDGSLYLVAGEAPYGDPVLADLVTDTLNSFTIAETA